ncbi:MAG: hypothetical protein JWL83_2528 [Actinomycetia bacterium]|jgi:hypothetical protein|nr:hypothetical protein [Actinomycetes bacterium]
MTTLRIETTNSVWFFDEERSHFRRVPRDAEEVFANDDWQPYYGLEIDADTGAFTVLLDPDGAHRYRSYTLDAEIPVDITANAGEPTVAVEVTDPGSSGADTEEIRLTRSSE